MFSLFFFALNNPHVSQGGDDDDNDDVFYLDFVYVLYMCCVCGRSTRL